MCIMPTKKLKVKDLPDKLQRLFVKERHREELAEFLQRCGNDNEISAINTLVEMNLDEVLCSIDVSEITVKSATIEKFYSILTTDSTFSGYRYNLHTDAREVLTDDEKIVPWDKTQEAKARFYIEKTYNLHNREKLEDALFMFFASKQYNPIIDYIENIQWDGKKRCGAFLHDILNAADLPYVREVSRLIFAGGIHRLYEHGCKFDYMPILIGKQGCRKSTICRWLAMNDTWFSDSLKKFDGSKEAIEAMHGAWIVEIGELSALKKAESEEMKAFITRQTDKYRKPYASLTTDNDRKCIFIGTTNNQQFLTDKTGNRRFLPVHVLPDTDYIDDHEEEIKEYIRQCWAEARENRKSAEMRPYIKDKAIQEQAERAARDAMFDDWRESSIRAIIERPDFERITPREAWEMIYSDSGRLENYNKESSVIVSILNSIPELEYKGSYVVKGRPELGKQRTWFKKKPITEETAFPPF